MIRNLRGDDEGLTRADECCEQVMNGSRIFHGLR